MRKSLVLSLICIGIVIFLTSLASASDCGKNTIPALPPGAKMLQRDSQIIRKQNISTWILFQMNTTECFLQHEMVFISNNSLGNKVSISESITPASCNTTFKED